MAVENKNLAEQCERAAQAARMSVGWFDANAEEMGSRYYTLRRAFRGYERELRKLADAAKRPPSIGIFGPSQVGKSYLVSALATREGAPLITRIDGRDVDFIKEINPEGGGNEATGVVTRFTVQKQETPAGKPVTVRLLSQVDLLKIIINTFMLDIDPAIETPAPEDVITQALDVAEKMAAKSSPDGLTDLDMNDLREYFRDNFSSRKTTDALERADYWNRMEKIAPGLPIDQRLKLYAFMWNDIAELTGLYKRLYDAIASLGFPDKVYCGAEALLPRDNSIIDVERLQYLMDDDSGRIEICTLEGKAISLPRPVLTALVAELIITLPDAPWNFLKHTDLLDFPGARSRYKLSDLDKFFSDPVSIGKLLLRGKVAYLFERYRTEFGLSTLLLCIKPGNQEVRTLGDLVNPWIHNTQGRNPKERKGADTTLFFVSTMFDKHFEQSGGNADNTDENWTKLIRNSLIDLFGVNDSWVEEWTPGQPFNNVFWGRSPGQKTTLMTYDVKQDGSRMETGIAEPDFVARVKREYLANELIRRHVADPEEKWEAVLKLNDGGGTYIANRLEGACRPELKDRQIQTRFEQLRDEMLRSLYEYYISDDSEEQRKKRVKTAKEALRALLPVVQSEKFGHMLDFMSIQDSELLQLMRRVASGKADNDAEEILAGSKPSKELLNDLIGDLLKDDEDTDESEALDADNSPAIEDNHSRLASAILQYWSTRLSDLSHNNKVLNFLGMPAEHMETILRELENGVERENIVARLADINRKYADAVDRSAYAFYKSASLIARLLNEYAVTMGQSLVPPERRLIRPRSGEPVFSSHEWIEELTELELQDTPRSARIFADWAQSFIHLVEENAKGGKGIDYDPEQNAALGRIIQQLEL